MGITTMIMGKSGTGKSTSVETLNPSETFLISVLGKPLPFKGFAKKYVPAKDKCATGNYVVSDKFEHIVAAIDLINRNRPDIKNIIIDDINYIMTNAFFRRADEKGFNKFVDIGKNMWQILDALSHTREDLLSFVLWHSELTDDGSYKCKTIGKLLDEKDTPEGRVLVTLCSMVVDGNYKFLTQHNGTHPAKSPRGMFENKLIDNDLGYVRGKIEEYFNE